LPSSKIRRVIAPGDGIEFLAEIGAYHTRKMVQDLHEEFPPDQFIQETFIMLYVAHDAPDAHGPETQVNRKMAGTVQGGIIPVFSVIVQVVYIVIPHFNGRTFKSNLFQGRKSK